MEDEGFLDCCVNPKLKLVKIVHESGHDDESLHQCQSCGGYWFYRFAEYVSFHGDDDITVWYSPVTPEEAKTIIESTDRPDLSFLLNRPGFMKDDNGVTRTAGQPDRPRYY